MTAPDFDELAVELSVIVPVFNEADNIESVLRAITGELDEPYELLVVYDFDEDNTVPVVERLQPELPQVRLIRNRMGRGVVHAIRAGLEEARGTFVVITMADGSDDPRTIKAMIDKARSGAAVVAASRYMSGGRQIGGPRLKSLFSRFAGALLHSVAMIETHDPTNNYKLYSTAFLQRTPIESRRGFELALELTVKAKAAGERIAEVPTTWVDRTAGTSNWNARALLPGYLRWFAFGMASSLPTQLRVPIQRRCSTAEASPPANGAAAIRGEPAEGSAPRSPQ